MKSILFLGLMTASLTTLGGHDDPKTHKTARPAKTLAAALGRCSGDAGCSACRNCSACGHCAGGGGTCGVCASYSTPVRTFRAPARTRSMTTRSYSGGGQFYPQLRARQAEDGAGSKLRLLRECLDA